MKKTSNSCLMSALGLLLALLLWMPANVSAQDDGGEDKPKKEKAEKPPKEKKEKPPKEKKEKAPKEKKEKDSEEKKVSGEKSASDGGGEKPPKEKKSRRSDGDEDFSDELKGAGFNIPLDTTGGEDPPKDLIGGVDDTSRVSVPCWRYRSGYMEFIDKNYHGIKIQRTKKKEIHTNTIDGNKLIFKIVWESDYVYKLQFVKAKLPSRFKKGYSMTCKMTDCWDEYYDCDCALNGIVQYASVLKTLSPKELKAKAKDELQKLKDAEHAAEKGAKKGEGGDNEVKGGDAGSEETKGEKPEKNNGKTSDVKPEKNNGKASGMKQEKVKKEKKSKEKKVKEPKAKKEKKTKEKKEKEPKEKKEK